MKKILMVGAGFLQRFVIQKARSMGYYTLAVDGNPNAVGLADADEYAVVNIVDQEAVLAYAREKRIDGVMTAATDYGVLSASYVAQQLHLPGLDYTAAQRVKNKYEIRKCLFDAGADDSVLSQQVTQDTDLQLLASRIHYPVMVKPCDGSGSRGAAKIEEAEAFPEACREAMANSLIRRATIEPFVVGQEYGVESCVVNGTVHVLAVMRKWMTQPPYYAELGHAIPSGLPEEIENKIRACAAAAIRALGINFGAVNMDLLLTKSGSVHIVDVGARMGGNLICSHIVPAGTGIDYVGNMIRAAVGDPVDLHGEACSAVATRLLAFREGTVNDLPDVMALEKTYGVEIYHHMTEGMHVNEYHTNLDGCGYIVAKSETIEVAIEKATAVLTEYQASVK